jgi:hypothetical protein
MEANKHIHKQGQKKKQGNLWHLDKNKISEDIMELVILQRENIYTYFYKKDKSYLCNMPWRPIGLWDVEAATSSSQSVHR